MAHDRVKFGMYELDLRAGELRKSGTRIRLQGKPLAVLAALLERSGEVVTREELRERLWRADTFVDFDHSLSVAIRKLREALCDSADQPRYIETLPRRGYRFLMAVEKVGSERCMLAVLPFAHPNHEDEVFADGLTDEMITQLGRLNPKALGVIARNSSLAHRGSNKSVPEIARELKVDYLLEGSVQQDEVRVRIRIRLVQSSDQTQLWAESYDRPVEDLLAVQVEVATEVARRLAIELLPTTQSAMARASSRNREAHRLYMLGRSQWSQRTVQAVERALVYFRQAVEADLGFALAHVGVADAYALLGYYGVMSPQEAFAIARTSAETALAINPELAEPHSSLAFVLLQADWDWPAAEREHRQAIELNQNYASAFHWYGIDLTQVGSFKEAEKALSQALALDPMEVATHAHVGRLRYFEREHPQAIKKLEKVTRADPSYAPAYYFLGLAWAQSGQYEKAIAALQTALVLAPGHPASQSGLAYVHGLAGRREEAAKERDRVSALAQKCYVSPFFLAFANLSLDREATFQHLEAAFRDRAPWLLYLDKDPAFDVMREDPRFGKLQRRLGTRAAHA